MAEFYRYLVWKLHRIDVHSKVVDLISRQVLDVHLPRRRKLTSSKGAEVEQLKYIVVSIRVVSTALPGSVMESYNWFLEVFER